MHVEISQFQSLFSMYLQVKLSDRDFQGGGENVSLRSSFLWYKTNQANGHELLKLVISHFNGFNGIG